MGGPGPSVRGARREKTTAARLSLSRSCSLSLSLDACNPYYEHPRCEIIQAAFPLVFHLAPTHLGRGTQR
jgi:hypothetical protein